MRQSLTTLLLWLTVALCGADTWRAHPPFGGEVERLIDTGGAVYVGSLCQPYTPGSATNGRRALSLFCFDKQNSELLSPLSDRSSPVAEAIEWSPAKNWLVIVHPDGEVRIVRAGLSDDRLTAFRDVKLKETKSVSSIFIDEKEEIIYLATGFGYVSLDPSTRRLRTICRLGRDVKAISRIGDRLLLLSGDEILGAPVAGQPQSADGWEHIARIDGAIDMKPVGHTLTVVIGRGETDTHRLVGLQQSGGEITLRRLAEGNFYNLEPNPRGLTVPTGSRLLQISPDGSVSETLRRESDWRVATASADGKEYWFADPRRGLWSASLSAAGWREGVSPLVPSAPGAYRTDQMVIHPDGSLLVANHGHNSLFSLSDNGGGLRLSSYRDGKWTDHTPPLTSGRSGEPLSNPNGPAVSPADDSEIWFGSVLNGLERIDLTGKEPPLHLSRTGDPFRGQTGFHAIVGDQSGSSSWKESCSFSTPVFDDEGNMWSVYGDFDDQSPAGAHLFLWVAGGEPTAPTRLKIPGLEVSNVALLCPLLHGKSQGRMLYTSRLWGSPLSLIDFGDTPSDQSDDVVMTPALFRDQDGNIFEPERIYFLEEDSDGKVWAGCSRGVFRFDPSETDGTEWPVTRIKVSRDDGSGYADYLLDGVPVSGMTTDGAGHRWFATSGAGLVVTTADGRTVVREYTSSDSPLRDNVVYGVAWIPASRSLMVSTADGLQELTPSLPVAGDGQKVSLKVWPNPVRPGYTGYVTIEGLPGEGLIKIVDAAGNCVSQLPCGVDGRALWDVTDIARRRVGSGVYHILCSSSRPDTSWTAKSKILIVNN